jgi:hypothetical protein
MPGNSDDDVPRWELPVYDESEEVPRWTPGREVPRWQPRRGPAPSAPPVASGAGRAGGARPGARSGAATRPGSSIPISGRERARRVSPVAWPFVWWAAHPWVVLWAFVFLAPASVLLLRVIDESSFDITVQPLAWLLVVVFVIALALAVVASARRSVARRALGGVAALLAVGMLLWPVTRVTLGRVPCPARAGNDLGTQVAGRALQAWRSRAGGGDDLWRRGVVDEGWRERTRGIRLTEFQLAESGCWERAAPVDGTHTWHEFRVTVQGAERASLSKIVLVHTELGREGWKITAIEGPLP